MFNLVRDAGPRIFSLRQEAIRQFRRNFPLEFYIMQELREVWFLRAETFVYSDFIGQDLASALLV